MATTYTVKRTNRHTGTYFFANAGTWVETTFPWDTADYQPKTFTDLTGLTAAVEELRSTYPGQTFEIVDAAGLTVYVTTFHADVVAYRVMNAMKGMK